MHSSPEEILAKDYLSHHSRVPFPCEQTWVCLSHHSPVPLPCLRSSSLPLPTHKSSDMTSLPHEVLLPLGMAYSSHGGCCSSVSELHIQLSPEILPVSYSQLGLYQSPDPGERKETFTFQPWTRKICIILKNMDMFPWMRSVPCH